MHSARPAAVLEPSSSFALTAHVAEPTTQVRIADRIAVARQSALATATASGAASAPHGGMVAVHSAIASYPSVSGAAGKIQATAVAHVDVRHLGRRTTDPAAAVCMPTQSHRLQPQATAAQPGGVYHASGAAARAGKASPLVAASGRSLVDACVGPGRRFRIGKKIGSGSFGDVHLGMDLQTGEEVGVKIESATSCTPQLLFESKIYKLLAGGVGIPNVHWYGSEGTYNVMVMELLGPSLEDLFNYCNRRLSLKTVHMLADQMISRLQYVHTKKFLHRDIKPDNFLVGIGSKGNQVHIIDFGLAKKYMDSKTGHHIPLRERKSLTGTARYASINTHLGYEQSRRDDLEAVGYVLVYFLRGSLPWQGLKAHSKREKYQKICKKKVETPPERLCEHLPTEFVQYLKYCRGLLFEDTPDYAYLRHMLKDLFFRTCGQWDFMYDWTINSSRRSSTATTPTTAVSREVSMRKEEPTQKIHSSRRQQQSLLPPAKPLEEEAPPVLSRSRPTVDGNGSSRPPLQGACQARPRDAHVDAEQEAGGMAALSKSAVLSLRPAGTTVATCSGTAAAGLTAALHSSLAEDDALLLGTSPLGGPWARGPTDAADAGLLPPTSATEPAAVTALPATSTMASIPVGAAPPWFLLHNSGK